MPTVRSQPLRHSLVAAMGVLALVAAACGGTSAHRSSTPSNPNHFSAKVSGGSISFDVRRAGGKIVSIKPGFTWRGLECGGGGPAFPPNGSLGRLITVKNDSFSRVQDVENHEPRHLREPAPPPVRVTIRGAFFAHGTEARGSFHIRGACTFPWEAKAA